MGEQFVHGLDTPSFRDTLFCFRKIQPKQRDARKRILIEKSLTALREKRSDCTDWGTQSTNENLLSDFLLAADGDILLERKKSAFFDPANMHQFVNRLKASNFFPIFEDVARKFFANARE